ncbi:MAG: MMPL family transporter [Polyangiaceae bacterium]|nr:MMPL family transporter [Polyangiaceae bacterium]
MNLSLMQSWRRWGGLLALSILLAFLVLIASKQWRLDTSMIQFLPDQKEQETWTIGRDVIDSNLSRQMIISVRPQVADAGLAPTEEKSRLGQEAALVDISQSLATAYRKIPGVSQVRNGPPKDSERQFYELYFPARYGLQSLWPEEEIPATLSPQGLELAAQQLKSELAGPDSLLVRPLAPDDPLQTFLKVGARLQEQLGHSMGVKDGVFISEDSWAILFLSLSDSALDGQAQKRVIEGLSQATEEVERALNLKIERQASGPNLFAVDTEARMRGDMERVSLISILGSLLFVLLLLPSWRKVLYLVLPLVFGFFAAAASILLCFGQLHVITLAFGSALIGIAIDYPAHLVCHADFLGGVGVVRELGRRLRPTLLLAALTTIAGLAGLSWASFPGLQQVAVFASVGLLVALVTSFAALPLLPRRSQPARRARVVASFLSRLVSARRPMLWAVLALASVAALVGPFTAHFAPGIESLAPLNPRLLAEDKLVRERVGVASNSQLLLAKGADVQAALLRNEEAARRLSQLAEKDSTLEWTTISSSIFSNELQERNWRAFGADESPPSWLAEARRAFAQEGFFPDAFPGLQAPFPRPALLDFEQLRSSSFGALLETFLVQTADQVVVVTPLSSEDSEQLEAAFKEEEGLELFSQKRMIDAAYTTLRERTAWLLLLGLGAVWGAAWLRYRVVRFAWAATLPSFLAASATLGVLAFTSQELNLLHILSLVLVCSMGVDYGIFVVDARTSRDASIAGQATMLSTLLGCLTTVTSFGALAFSQAPALAAIGQTTALGVVLALILAPTVATLILPSRVAIN